MLARHLNGFEPGSAQDVVLHAAIRWSRRKRPSKQYRGIRDPRKALEKAKEDVMLMLTGETLPGFQHLLGTPMLFQALGLGNNPFDPRIEAYVAANFDKKFAAWAGITT